MTAAQAEEATRNSRRRQAAVAGAAAMAAADVKLGLGQDPPQPPRRPPPGRARRPGGDAVHVLPAGGRPGAAGARGRDHLRPGAHPDRAAGARRSLRPARLLPQPDRLQAHPGPAARLLCAPAGLLCGTARPTAFAGRLARRWAERQGRWLRPPGAGPRQLPDTAHHRTDAPDAARARQGVTHFRDIRYTAGLTYGEMLLQNEYEMSCYNLERADVASQRQLYALFEQARPRPRRTAPPPPCSRAPCREPALRAPPRDGAARARPAMSGRTESARTPDALTWSRGGRSGWACPRSSCYFNCTGQGRECARGNNNMEGTRRAPFGVPRRAKLKACFSQLGLLRRQKAIPVFCALQALCRVPCPVQGLLRAWRAGGGPAAGRAAADPRVRPAAAAEPGVQRAGRARRGGRHRARGLLRDHARPGAPRRACAPLARLRALRQPGITPCLTAPRGPARRAAHRDAWSSISPVCLLDCAARLHNMPHVCSRTRSAFCPAQEPCQ